MAPTERMTQEQHLPRRVDDRAGYAKGKERRGTTNACGRRTQDGSP